jgi:hypothetical protein
MGPRRFLLALYCPGGFCAYSGQPNGHCGRRDVRIGLGLSPDLCRNFDRLDFSLSCRAIRRLVVWLIGEEKYKKYTKIFRSDLSWGLFIIFLIPFFPDDILCILAGISPLPLRRFIILVAIGRAPSALFNSAIGAGLLKADDFNIPWWVWALAAAVIVGLGVVYFLNKSKINRWLEQRLGLDADGDGDSDSDNESNSKEEGETEKNSADKNNHQPVIHRMKRTEKSPS